MAHSPLTPAMRQMVDAGRAALERHFRAQGLMPIEQAGNLRVVLAPSGLPGILLELSLGVDMAADTPVLALQVRADFRAAPEAAAQAIYLCNEWSLHHATPRASVQILADGRGMISLEHCQWLWPGMPAEMFVAMTENVLAASILFWQEAGRQGLAPAGGRADASPGASARISSVDEPILGGLADQIRGGIARRRAPGAVSRAAARMDAVHGTLQGVFDGELRSFVQIAGPLINCQGRLLYLVRDEGTAKQELQAFYRSLRRDDPCTYIELIGIGTESPEDPDWHKATPEEMVNGVIRRTTSQPALRVGDIRAYAATAATGGELRREQADTAVRQWDDFVRQLGYVPTAACQHHGRVGESLRKLG